MSVFLDFIPFAGSILWKRCIHCRLGDKTYQELPKSCRRPSMINN